MKATVKVRMTDDKYFFVNFNNQATAIILPNKSIRGWSDEIQIYLFNFFYGIGGRIDVENTFYLFYPTRQYYYRK